MVRRVVIAGGGLAGLRAIEALRRQGFDGAITMILGEPELPYDRPPLSKQVLTGEHTPESTIYRSAEFFSDADIELVAGPATALNPQRRVVEVGRELVPYDDLLLCTGAAPRRLPPSVADPSLDGVLELRTIDDARRLKQQIGAAQHVVVIGAGFVGAEVASSARQLGRDVTLIEALAAPLERALGRETAEVCASLHAAHGTELLCGAAVEAVEGREHVETVRLASGRVIECDLVVAGIGVSPDTRWLDNSGLRLDDGIVCDAHLRTSLPGVHAAGDVARWFNPLFGVDMRCEQWTNAAEQGRHVAGNIARGPAESKPFCGSNYFWSDQYGERIQFAGVTVSDEVKLVWGEPAERRFVALYRQADRVVGAFGMNAVKQLIKAKGLVESASGWPQAVRAFD